MVLWLIAGTLVLAAGCTQGGGVSQVQTGKKVASGTGMSSRSRVEGAPGAGEHHGQRSGLE